MSEQEEPRHHHGVRNIPSKQRFVLQLRSYAGRARAPWQRNLLWAELWATAAGLLAQRVNAKSPGWGHRLGALSLRSSSHLPCVHRSTLVCHWDAVHQVTYDPTSYSGLINHLHS